MSPARARVPVALTGSGRDGPADGPPDRRPAGDPVTRGCRSGSWRGSRGRAAPGRPAGRRRRRAGGSRRNAAACAARCRPAGRPARRGGRGGSGGRGRRAGRPRWFRKISAGGGSPSARSGQQDRPAVLEIGGDGARGRSPEQPDPLLAALAEHAQLAAAELQRAEVRRRQLADAQTRRRRRSRPAPGRAGPGRRGARPAPWSSPGRASRSSSTTASIRATCSTSSTRGSRRGSRGVAIAPHGSPGGQVVARRPAVERADRGEPLRDRRASVALAQHAEVGPQVGARSVVASRSRVPRASRGRPPTAVRVGPLGMRGGVARGEGAEEPREGGVGRGRGRRPLTRRRPARPGVDAPRRGRGRRGRRRVARPPVFAAPPARRRAARTRRPGQGLRVGRTARVALARHDVAAAVSLVEPQIRHSAVLVLAGQRPVVGVVEAAERLVVRREIAARVVRAPPEDVPGAPRATRDEMAVLVLGADDLERERIGRWRAVLLDELALGIARAADERAEPAASC